MSAQDGQFRTRTVRWEHPQRALEAAPGMSGMEFLEAIRRGELPPPPIATVLGFTLTELSPGRAVFQVEPGEHQYNIIGVVHGGLSATVLDSAMGCAVLTQLAKGVTFTTLQLNLHFTRAAHEATGTLKAEARVVHAGRQIVTAEGSLVDTQGKIYVHGTTTCLVRPARIPAPATAGGE